MQKKEVRKVFREKRSRISLVEKNKWDDLLLIQFQTVALPYISTIMSFYPIEEKKEVNTFLLTDYLLFKYPGLQIAYPKTDVKANTMQAVLCNEETLFEKNSYNIHEPELCEIINPEQLEMVLVPMLAFDKKGSRVGYGKGYYDTFLKQCTEDCLKVGLCYFDPVELIEDADEFDVPLNYCITPHSVYVF